jgi:predicted phage terminase large subunit-like protein
MSPEAIELIRTDFASFVRKAFHYIHDGRKLGKQPYVDYLCFELEKVISGETRRLLVNLPPRHLKTFLGSICLAAWTLAKNPSARIIVVTFSDKLAEHISRDIRKILRAPWFKQVFTTRLADDHSRADDFQTTRGGGVYAVSSNGALAGRGGDLIIFDDPMDLKDWNNMNEIERTNERFDGMIMSRFNNLKEGRAVVIAHRLNDHDLSDHLIAQGGWRTIVLPFIAARMKNYNLGYTVWQRKKGTLLRPDAYSKKEIKRLQTAELTPPPFYLYYQQGQGTGARLKIKSEHFQSYLPHMVPIAPIVLSIDAAQKGGPNNSYNVIQAWTSDGQSHFLLAQWRDQCGYLDLLAAYKFFSRKFRPSAVLIEDTANGSALLEEARRKPWIEVIAVTPDGRSKAARLLDHVATIRKKRIYLPDEASLVGTFVGELVNFPGEFDDQVDAMTQYLAFMATKPSLELPPERGIAVGVGFSRGALGVPDAQTRGNGIPARFGVVRLNSR